MLIEPAILMLFNSMRVLNQAGPGGAVPANSPAAALGGLSVSLTSMSFDFLCRIVNNFHLPLREHILNGLMQAFKDSVDKRVIPSLQGFFGSSADKSAGGGLLDRDLRALVQATFGNFFQTMNISQVSSSAATAQTPPNVQSPVLMPKPIIQTPSPSGSPTASSITTGMAESMSPMSTAVTFQNSSSMFRQQHHQRVTPVVVEEMPSDVQAMDAAIKMESQGKSNHLLFHKMRKKSKSKDNHLILDTYIRGILIRACSGCKY